MLTLKLNSTLCALCVLALVGVARAESMDASGHDAVALKDVTEIFEKGKQKHTEMTAEALNPADPAEHKTHAAKEEEPKIGTTVASGSVLEETIDGRELRKLERIKALLRQASVAARAKETTNAEALYLQVLTMEITKETRREVLLEMVKLYDGDREPSKQAAVLEKFVESFPEDPALSQVFIKLGITYRKMGLFKLAIARFYSVLNYSLRIDQSQIEAYRTLSLRAQLEIADTYFVMAQYDDALKYYTRLRLLDLKKEDRAHSMFRAAYCQYLLKQDSQAVAALEAFLRDYADDDNIPEATFLLATAYGHVGRHNEASRMVLNLLKTEADKDAKQYVYWQKKAGNQLANDFFEQNDYSSALAIYQAMIDLGADPEWQWPILYQIGLCFERLNMAPKAIESYKTIIEWPNKEPDWQREGALHSKALKSIYDMAKWRIDNLKWKADAGEKLENLLDNNSR